jgi:putative sterol carrier protein
LWDEFQRDRDQRGFARHLVKPTDAPLPVRLLQESLGSLRGAIGTPAQVRDLLERYEQAGVDEVIFVSQAGRNQHEHICESLELFAREVLPPFVERNAAHEADKRDRLAPAIERALQRRPAARPAPAGYTIWPDREPWQHAARNGRTVEHRQDLPRAALGWLVQGRSDAQLERIFGSGIGQALIFRGMERAFRHGPTEGVRGTLQYHLTTRRGTRSWVVRVADGRLVARPGTDPRPSATVRLDAATFARIAAGQQTAGSAAMLGALQMEGDLRLVARIGALLGQPPV